MKFLNKPGKEIKRIGELSNNQEPTITIITPFYNGGSTLEETANTILSQTYPYFEWIIIDDGSKSESCLKKLDEVKKNLEYASYMCREVISLYKTMDIPQLSDDRYTEIIDDARNDVKMADEAREKAMESAITLINTKNPKYIGKITEYLSLSDNCISNFKDRLTDLNKIIDKQ